MNLHGIYTTSMVAHLSEQSRYDVSSISGITVSL